MIVEHSAYLTNTTRGHNKHYFVVVIKLPILTETYALRTAYGAIGNVPKEDAKGTVFNSKHDAVEALRNVVSDKLSKGYDLQNSVTCTVGPNPSWVSDKTTATPRPKKISTTQSIFAKRKRTAQWRF